MNKVIGAILIIIGLILIGLGTYKEFEYFESTFVNDEQKSYHDGLYITSGDTIAITSLGDEVIDAIINNAEYRFRFNGVYFENKISGFYIEFNDNELILYKDGEKIRSLYKK